MKRHKIPGKKLWKKFYERILQREGVFGIVVRLLYPKRNGGSAALTPHFPLLFRIEGEDKSLVDATMAAFSLLIGEEAHDRTRSAHCLHLSPMHEGRDFTERDVVLFNNPEIAKHFINQGSHAEAPLFRRMSNCAAVLLPSVECFELFKNAGMGPGRMFIMPSLSKAFSHYDIPSLAGDFARWLIAANAMTPKDVHPLLFSGLQNLEPNSRLCLSLPETPLRRKKFESLELQNFKIFDGIRYNPGWLGCGWSYATIARAALDHNAVPLVVCEDDIQPSKEFQDHLSTIEAYLENAEWDIFSGLVTDISNNSRIRHIEQYNALTFIHLDYTMGMIFNIYNRRALEWLAKWSPSNGDVGCNMIDAWLAEMPDLRVVTTLPFLAGHDTNQTSTILGFSNKRYETVIRAGERRLQKLVSEAGRARGS